MVIPQEELPILEAIINIKNRLTVLKKDRGEFIKASDVQNLYQQMVKQVTKLNEVRRDQTASHNRVDMAMADVFNLLSLFFLRIGKNREMPATYCQIVSIRHLLEHMSESSVFRDSDLAPFRTRLGELRSIIQRGQSQGESEQMVDLLKRELGECDALLDSLQQALAELSPELVPIYERLVHIRRQLASLAAKTDPSKAELRPLLDELRAIDGKRVDGKFMSPDRSYFPPSQAPCISLIEECHEIAQDIRAQEDKKNVAGDLAPIFERLNQMKSELESLNLTRRWSLRETDLWNYSIGLQEIEKLRVDGKFVDAEGNRHGGQYSLLYLLRRCYGLIYGLLSASEPVAEELIPIANKLSTVKKCLNEVLKFGGPFSPRDLYPYQLALYQIDSRRKEGKFMGSDGSVPEGQGILMAHLNEAHELLEMLKESMEEENEQEVAEEEGEGEAVVANGDTTGGGTG